MADVKRKSVRKPTVSVQIDVPRKLRSEIKVLAKAEHKQFRPFVLELIYDGTIQRQAVYGLQKVQA